MTHAEISPARIFAVRDFAALLVAEHGEPYLPLFERLEAEVAALDTRTAAIERARALAARRR